MIEGFGINGEVFIGFLPNCVLSFFHIESVVVDGSLFGVFEMRQMLFNQFSHQIIEANSSIRISSAAERPSESK